MQFCVKNESRENDKTFYITYSGKKHLSAAIKMLFDRLRVVFCYQKEYNCEKRKIMLIRLSYLDLCWSWSSLLWHFMSRIKVAVDPQGPTLNLLYSGVMDGDMSETVSWSQFSLTCPLRILDCELDLKVERLDIQCLKGPATVLRHRLFTAFLFSASVAHSCTVHVPVLHGGWMLKCVWQNNIFDVACNLLIMSVKAPNLPAGKICIFYIVMQLYTLYWPRKYTE